MCCYLFFFFQAEDGIRDRDVTGVQTCALPICRCRRRPGGGVARPIDARGEGRARVRASADRRRGGVLPLAARSGRARGGASRSEERRVGKEWRCRGWRASERKKS